MCIVEWAFQCPLRWHNLCARRPGNCSRYPGMAAIHAIHAIPPHRHTALQHHPLERVLLARPGANIHFRIDVNGHSHQSPCPKDVLEGGEAPPKPSPSVARTLRSDRSLASHNCPHHRDEYPTTPEQLFQPSATAFRTAPDTITLAPPGFQNIAALCRGWGALASPSFHPPRPTASAYVRFAADEVGSKHAP